MSELLDVFHNHFEVVPANSDTLLETAYRLRYQVYCIENNYENANHFPDLRETDEYDDHSVHSLVQCKATRKHAGLVRLVLPNPQDAQKLLPIERFCETAGEDQGLNLAGVPRESLAEISRFCLSKAVRTTCRQQAFSSDMATCADQADLASYRQMMPHITIGLFSGILRMSLQNGITHWLAVMEPTLLRFLTRFGIHFRKVGPLVNFHGVRQPVVAVMDEVLARIHKERIDVWNTITDSGALWAAPVESQHAIAGR